MTTCRASLHYLGWSVVTHVRVAILNFRKRDLIGGLPVSIANVVELIGRRFHLRAVRLSNRILRFEANRIRNINDLKWPYPYHCEPPDKENHE